jgi:hypothetical protein
MVTLPGDEKVHEGRHDVDVMRRTVSRNDGGRVR